MLGTILIEWRSEYSVHVPSIDEQHKKLVNMINALNSAMESGLTDAVLASIFDGLLQYAEKHFAYEEALLEQTRYVAAAAHRREHDDLRKQALALKERVDRGELVLGVEAMVFLREWLTRHIMGSDRAYSKHLVESGVR